MYPFDDEYPISSVYNSNRQSGTDDEYYPSALGRTSSPSQDVIQRPVGGETPSRGIGGFIQDVGIDVASGAIGLGEDVVGLLDIPTFNLAGQALEAIGYKPQYAKEILKSYYSDARKANNQEVSDAGADGFVSQAISILQNPDVLLGNIIESGVVMGGISGVTRAVARKMIAKAGIKTAAEASEFLKRKDVASKLLAVSAIGEGAMTTGQIMEQGRQGGKEWEETVAPAVAAGAVTAGISRLSSAILPDADAETMAAQIGLKKAGLAEAKMTATDKILDAGKTIAKTMFKEGALEEMPQSAQEQVFTNLAMGKPWSEGVESAAAQGLVVGAMQAGGIAGISKVTEGLPSAKDITPEAIEEMLQVATDPDKIKGIPDANLNIIRLQLELAYRETKSEKLAPVLNMLDKERERRAVEKQSMDITAPSFARKETQDNRGIHSDNPTWLDEITTDNANDVLEDSRKYLQSHGYKDFNTLDKLAFKLAASTNPSKAVETYAGFYQEAAREKFDIVQSRRENQEIGLYIEKVDDSSRPWSVVDERKPSAPFESRFTTLQDAKDELQKIHEGEGIYIEKVEDKERPWSVVDVTNPAAPYETRYATAQEARIEYNRMMNKVGKETPNGLQEKETQGAVTLDPTKYMTQDDFGKSFSFRGVMETPALNGKMRDNGGQVEPAYMTFADWKSSDVKRYSSGPNGEILVFRNKDISPNGTVAEGAKPVFRLKGGEEPYKQLTEIWNKAQEKETQGQIKQSDIGLMEEASKFKTVDEFIKSQGTPAFHSGDLGTASDTTLGRMDVGRGTGHFGTGTYFVSDSKKLKGDYEKRPIQEAHIIGANLYKPGSTANAVGLHDALRDLNRIVFRKQLSEDDLSDVAFRLRMRIPTKILDANENILDIVKDVVKEVRREIHGSNQWWDSEAETASTRFMKRLGFDGIDVRHLKDESGYSSPDDTHMGTVVYDKSKIKTSKELRDIWDKAHGKETQGTVEQSDVGLNQAFASTARKWNGNQKVYKAVSDIVNEGDDVMDFGSGKLLEGKPAVVDNGGNYFAHDPYQGINGDLTRQYDVVMGSNVLNVQVKAGENAKQYYSKAINDMVSLVKDNGILVVNMPSNGPKAEWMSPQRLEKDLATMFNDVRRQGEVIYATGKKGQEQIKFAAKPVKTQTREQQKQALAEVTPTTLREINAVFEEFPPGPWLKVTVPRLHNGQVYDVEVSAREGINDLKGMVITLNKLNDLVRCVKA